MRSLFFNQRIASRKSAIDAAMLEDRVLYSAAPLAVAAVNADQGSVPGEAPAQTAPSYDSLTTASDDPAVDQAATEFRFCDVPTETEQRQADFAEQAVRLELVFVDTGTADYQQLVDDILRSADPTRELEVYLLDAQRDGVEQISEILAGYSDLDAIHIVSHGSAGQVKLGSTWLNSDSMSGYAGDVAGWNSALRGGGDLLIYGCDLAANEQGRTLVESLAALSGADVAASTDRTGAREFAGDWNLEFQTGKVESTVAFSETLQANWHDLLGVITVNTTADVVDGNTSSIAALLGSAGADGFISLREAILATNNTAGADTIFLPTGTFTFTIGGQGEDAGSTGDLDISDGLTITGAGTGLSIIDANGLDRVFHVQPGVTATISDVTLRGGAIPLNDWGAGVLVDNGASLNLSRVVITGNSAGSGAGLYNYGTLVATDTVFSNNVASDWGGGLYNDRGNVTLDRVTISSNTAGSDGAGIYNTGAGAVMSLTNATVSGNTATGQGGGLFTNRAVTVINATIAFNDASAGDGVYGQGGTGTISFQNSILHNPAGANANKAMTSLGNNIDSDGTAGLAGPGDLVKNPLLDPILTDNGGFVPTHRVLAGSPAIDGGTSIGAPTVDARNISRDATPDIGAFEVHGQFVQTSEFRVNTTTSSSQVTASEVRGSTRAVAAADDGSYVVVWSSNSQDGDGWGVYGQRFDAAGNLIGGEFRINQTTTNDQHYASVAMNGSGEFVVAWTSASEDGSGNGVYARRYDAAGNPLGNEFLVNATTSGDQDSPVVAMGADGRFLIVWEGNGPGDSGGIFGRWYDAAGTPGSEVRINTVTSGLQGEPSVDMSPDGRAVVVWDDPNGVQAQRFDASGTASGAPINVSPMISAGEADVAMAADGSFAVVWRQTVSDIGICLQRYDAAGSAIGIIQIVSTTISGDQTNPSIAMDDAGDFVVVWEGVGTGDSDGVFGRLYDASGNAQGLEFLINQTTSNTQSMTSAVMLDATNYAVVWSGEGPGDSNGVFARQFGTTNVAPVITSNGGGATATVSIAENTSAVTTVTATDADLPAQTLTYSISGGADAARFTINSATGVLSFAVAPNYEAPTDAGANNVYDVTVQVSDGTLTDTQALAITVTNVNESPTAANDSYMANEDATLNVTAAGVLGNDSDVEGSALSALLVSGPANGALTLNPNGSFSYTPNADFNGSDSFTYRANDGAANSNLATVTITVNPLNDDPVAVGETFIATQGFSLGLPALAALLTNDSDVDGDVLTASLVSGPTNGTLTINADGSMTYTPNDGFQGVDSLTYLIDDGNGGTATATVSITVFAGGGPPVTPPDVSPPPTINDSSSNDDGSSVPDNPQLPQKPPAGSEVPSTRPVDRNRSETGSSLVTASSLVSIIESAPRETTNFVAYQPLVTISRILRHGLPTAVGESIQHFVESYDVGMLWNDLGDLKRELNAISQLPFFAAGSAATVTGAISVGYVLWLVRSGWLVTSLLAQIPAWSVVDPLMVLDYLDDDSSSSKAGKLKREDDDSLESMLRKTDEDPVPSTVSGAGNP